MNVDREYMICISIHLNPLIYLLLLFALVLLVLAHRKQGFEPAGVTDVNRPFRQDHSSWEVPQWLQDRGSMVPSCENPSSK